MLPSALIDMPLRYTAWNKALSDHFFRRQNSGRPVFLQIDSEALRHFSSFIQVAPADAEQDFIRTVQRVVDVSGREPFSRLEGWTRRWSRLPSKRDTAPPFIALLGLCVLAASRMHKDEAHGIASHNYYTRLNELLGRAESGQPQGFDRVTGFWKVLEDWLDVDNRGALGIATAAPIGRLQHVGYPISQSLVRDVDRDRLPVFFVFAHIAPGEALDGQDLIGLLMRWSQHSNCTLTSQLKNLILHGDADTRMQIARIVAAEALAWQGEMKDAIGQVSAPIALRVEQIRGGYEFDLQFYPRKPHGFPVGVFRSRDETFDLQPLDDERSAWYQLIPLDPQRVLTDGIELRHDRYTLRWAPMRTIVLVRDEQELGAYVSCPQVTLGEQAIILSRDPSQVESFLRRYAAPGWRPAPSTRGLPNGWSAFRNVIIQARADQANYPELTCLIPPQHVSISLKGGLKLDTSVWLTGAEPVLHVSCADAKSITIDVDGEHAVEASGAAAELDLSDLGLSGGEHTITTCGRSRRLQTVTSGDYAVRSSHDRNSQPLANVLVRRGHRYEATFPLPRPILGDALAEGELSIVGAQIRARPEDLPENLPQPVLLVGGAQRYILLGSQPGMIYECHDPAVPLYRFMGQPRQPRPFTAHPPFQAVWIIRVSRHNRSIQLNDKPTPVAEQCWHDGDTKAWAQCLTRRYRRLPSGEASALWQEYSLKARALL